MCLLLCSWLQEDKREHYRVKFQWLWYWHASAEGDRTDAMVSRLLISHLSCTFLVSISSSSKTEQKNIFQCVQWSVFGWSVVSQFPLSVLLIRCAITEVSHKYLVIVCSLKYFFWSKIGETILWWLAYIPFPLWMALTEDKRHTRRASEMTGKLCFLIWTVIPWVQTFAKHC